MSTQTSRRAVLAAGIFFLLMEVWKQWYLYSAVFGEWRVWYFPFQLCSMPIYLCFAYVLCPSEEGRAVLSCFLQDFGVLGGILALAVRSGFTFSGYPLLTAHGWLWHLGMIALAVYLWLTDDTGRTGSWSVFRKACVLFLALAAFALLLNVLLHPYGYADMFYISPYRISEQPVFREIDLALGRGPGIAIYLAAAMGGAALCHLLKICVHSPGKRV